MPTGRRAPTFDRAELSNSTTERSRTMEHVLHLPTTRTLVVPLAAAVLGAGLATTTYALIDSDQASQSKVAVTEPSGADSSAQPPTPFSGSRRF
jgi:hypothetical protein